MTSALKSGTTIQEIEENFAMLDEWDDRYGYLIELGRDLEPLPETARDDRHKVNGCVSQVWLDHERDGERIAFRGDSDAHIVRGLVAVALALYGDRPASDIIDTEAEPTFQRIGLAEHLTPQRANGLRAMVARIKQIAAAESA